MPSNGRVGRGEERKGIILGVQSSPSTQRVGRISSRIHLSAALAFGLSLEAKGAQVGANHSEKRLTILCFLHCKGKSHVALGYNAGSYAFTHSLI